MFYYLFHKISKNAKYKTVPYSPMSPKNVQCQENGNDFYPEEALKYEILPIFKIFTLETFSFQTCEKTPKNNFRVRTQTDFIRSVSSKLMLRGVPVVRGGRFDRFFEKTPEKADATIAFCKKQSITQTQLSGTGSGHAAGPYAD